MPTRNNHNYNPEPLWYKDAIIYELHVKTFHDGNNDGIGDFIGLKQKVEYLQSLGVTAIWLLPFYPSPLRDDGYDISDYMDVHPDYGTLSDFREFLKEVHQRGIKVITELIINHTSDQHQWFKRARQAKPDSSYRNFYVWNDTPDKYADARIIFKDFEPSNWKYDSGTNQYYWHRFYHHQPDLNFENPAVHKAIFNVVDFWLEMGVDGLRLDAVPYLYEEEGTNCENLPETHAFLKKLRSYVDKKYPNRMLIAEANQWPEDAVTYFGDGDECHMCFHFPLMPRIFMSIQMEDRFPIIDILDQTPPIPDSCQWASFLRNHDELTLEMVTDEERDYMYRVYATDPKARINLGIRRRLAPLLGNDRRQIELMNIMLFSLPGTPVVYYGDEIGMGDNFYLGDRNGVRTPMQWSSDRNAGFSRANPQKLLLPIIIDPEYHYEALNVDVQNINTSSLLWWMRRLIATTKRFKAFSRGSIQFILSDNPRVLSYTRIYEDEKLLVVMNLSKFSQAVELGLEDYVGYRPEEVFSQNLFPPISHKPYMITLGPYGYYWFALKEEYRVSYVTDTEQLPQIEIEKNWTEIFTEENEDVFLREKLLPYVRKCQWFGEKTLTVQSIRIVESIPMPKELGGYMLFLEFAYVQAHAECYQLPVMFAAEPNASAIKNEYPMSVISQVVIDGSAGIIYDAIYDQSFQDLLLQVVAQRKSIKGKFGRLKGQKGKKLKQLAGKAPATIESQALTAEQRNTSVIYQDKFFLKLYRKIIEGISPEPEITRFLTEKSEFLNVPAFAGSIEYERNGSGPYVMAVLQAFVPNQGDAWTLTLRILKNYYEEALSKSQEGLTLPQENIFAFSREDAQIPEVWHELIGGMYLEHASLLAKRTAEMHLAFASSQGDPDFDPEPFTPWYQRSVYQSMREQVRRIVQMLQRNIGKFDERIQQQIKDVLSYEKRMLDLFHEVTKIKIRATKIRIHGDYSLEKVLYTGKDFVIIDFEGEALHSFSERRLKRSPLRDVAGMLRSLHYATYYVLRHEPSLRSRDIEVLEKWALAWWYYIGGAFLKTYLDTVANAGFIPKNMESVEVLLKAFMLDKAVYEVDYELKNRPDRLDIPLRGIKQILDDPCMN